jgi:hypothetical protein
MAKGFRYKSTLYRIREVCEITREHYEEGSQSKCYRAVWRKYIEPKYGICYRTYLNYINEPLPKDPDGKQLSLFE